MSYWVFVNCEVVWMVAPGGIMPTAMSEMYENEIVALPDSPALSVAITTTSVVYRTWPLSTFCG